jgi:maltose alpha-D-glucosyltransferase/alpha-amylase
VEDIADLGRALGGLHLALASRADVPDFAPEAISESDLAGWKRRTRASLEQILARVEHGLRDGPADIGWSARDREYGAAICSGADRLRVIIEGIGVLADGRIVKTRHHGDFHLGQTLVASDGWMLIDFEGEPLRSLAERRAKQTPLRDVAGLLRSLDYARATVARQMPSPPRPPSPASGSGGSDKLDALFAACRESMLTAYVETVRAGGAPLLPASPADLSGALLALEVEKALYELAYELGNRPDWVSIPLSALARLAQRA